jgi:hypothetical protein
MVFTRWWLGEVSQILIGSPKVEADGSERDRPKDWGQGPLNWAATPPFIEALALIPTETWGRGIHRHAEGGGQLSLATHMKWCVARTGHWF